jgi:hypothetical protein
MDGDMGETGPISDITESQFGLGWLILEEIDEF